MNFFALCMLVAFGFVCFAYERWVETLRTHRRMGLAILHAPAPYLTCSWAYHLVSYGFLIGWFIAFRVFGFGYWTALIPVFTWFAAGGAAQRRAFKEYRQSLQRMLEDPDSIVDRDYLRRELELSNAELVLRIRQNERMGLQ